MGKAYLGIDHLTLTRRCSAPFRTRPQPGSIQTERSRRGAQTGERGSMVGILGSTSMSCNARCRVAGGSEWRQEVLSSKEWTIPVAACALFVRLPLGSAMWRAPGGDEGWFVSAADNRIRDGR